jgi:hypothetical protein
MYKKEFFTERQKMEVIDAPQNAQLIIKYSS